jgi:hypothetical protein
MHQEGDGTVFGVVDNLQNTIPGIKIEFLASKISILGPGAFGKRGPGADQEWERSPPAPNSMQTIG